MKGNITMKSRSIYYVCKQGNEYYSERRAIVYQNDKFTYIKRPGSKVLIYIRTDSIHYDFNPNKIEEGYYLKKPSKVVLNNLTIYESISQCRARLSNFYDRKDKLANELNHVNECIDNEEYMLANLLKMESTMNTNSNEIW